MIQIYAKIHSIRYWVATVIVAFGLVEHGAASFAQEIDTTVQQDGRVIAVHLKTFDPGCAQSELIVVGKMFCARLTIKLENQTQQIGGDEWSLKSLTASMPAHRHGMVTKPRITKVSPTEYMIEGLKFHMPGDWLIEIDLMHGNSTAHIAIPMKF